MFWRLPNAESGSAFLDLWTAEARSLGNRHFAKRADALDDHRLAFWPAASTGSPPDRSKD